MLLKSREESRETVKIVTPLTVDLAGSLAVGQKVTISGEIFAMRDTAHQVLVDMIRSGEPLPFDTTGAVIFYAGPTPAKPGAVVGSIGPTTSRRMDRFTPELLCAGVRGTMGKGPRGREVADAMVEAGAVYFAVTGGVAALLSRCVKSCETVALEHLGPEAILRLEIEDFPAIVAMDSRGGSLF
ncbi:MAG TPA: TRZ/ATZ family protein [candidate division Zixibacteria bacterium]|nr:TRZ/ATZ family protein [candidate division Zixibacteria bacterium]